MAQPLKQVSCEPDCGFMVQSHDYRELKQIVQNHAKTAHKMNVSDKEVDAMARTVTMSM